MRCSYSSVNLLTPISCPGNTTERLSSELELCWLTHQLHRGANDGGRWGGWIYWFKLGKKVQVAAVKSNRARRRLEKPSPENSALGSHSSKVLGSKDKRGCVPSRQTLPNNPGIMNESSAGVCSVVKGPPPADCPSANAIMLQEPSGKGAPSFIPSVFLVIPPS